jgi:hypothetical protein
VAGGDRRNADTVIIAALAGGATVRDAAVAAKVSEPTVYRRLQDAEFRHLVSEARGAMLARAVGQLADASTKAVTTLKDLLDAENESVALGAARSILDMGSKLRETTELEQRISELEARAASAAAAEAAKPRRGSV